MGRLVAKLELIVGTALLMTIVVLVFIAAVMRFFGHPLIWSIDTAQLLFIWLCFVGATRTMRLRGHIGVDLLVRMLGHKYRLWIETAQAIMFIAMMAVLAVEGYRLAEANSERVFGYSGMSYGLVTLAVSAGCVTLSLAIIANLVDAWRNRADGKTLIFSKTGNDPVQTEL